MSLPQFLFKFLIYVLAIPLVNCSGQANESQTVSDSSSLLIFTKTEGYRHQSIPEGVNAIEEIASQNDISTVHTEDVTYFQPDSLANFDIVLFLNTTGNILNEKQQTAFKQFIQNGGGFVGIHAASDTEFNWAWYGNMVGAYFESHPNIQEATITVVDQSHPSTTFLPDEWVRTDEWYNFKDINPDINVLMNLEESTYEGGKNGEDHPIAWYHEYDGGRIFYTAGGHTAESYSESLFKKHIQGGIKYVLKEK
jgi:type 1 glutamine amidotransferase